jgi:hypothetical protein
MNKCDLCGVGVIGKQYDAYWHLCPVCAREVFLHAPGFYADRSEYGWHKRIAHTEADKRGFFYSRSNPHFAAAVEQVKSHWTTCGQCGFVHDITPTPYPS